VIGAGMLFPFEVRLPFVKHGDLYRQMLGWRALADAVRERAKAEGAATIVTTDRGEVAELLYYLRDDPLAVLVWPRGAVPAHHFEMTRSLVDHPPAGPSLLVTSCAREERLAPFFADIGKLGDLSIPTGPSSARSYVLYRLGPPAAPLAPQDLCAGG
jgi:hypothetical protein